MKKLTKKDVEQSFSRREDWLNLPLDKKLEDVVERFYEGERHMNTMQCPQCGRSSPGMESDDWEFRCLWRDCNFRVTHEIIEQTKEKILSRKSGFTLDQIKYLKLYL